MSPTASPSRHRQLGLTDHEYELILDKLGRLAKTGDIVTIDGHRLVVLRADPTRIRRIRVEPVSEASPNVPT